MKHFRMEINSGMLPQLFLDFESTSDTMATDYAKRISCELASTKWGHFVLWDQASQDHVAEWTVTMGDAHILDMVQLPYTKG